MINYQLTGTFAPGNWFTEAVGLMARKSTIKLLLINESANEGERIISLFRNAGRVARAERPKSMEELSVMLQEESWDLVIANQRHSEINPQQLLEQLSKSKLTLPALIVADENEALTLLEAGAANVVNPEQDERLIQAAFRELQHIETYRELELVKEKLDDAEERCALLLNESQDAIAYVADGMIINANNLFCARFGYEEPDDLDCATVIDLIDESNHELFKNTLKAQTNNKEGSSQLEFSGIKQNGEQFKASMQLSSAVLDEETCIQITIRDNSSSSSNQNDNKQDHDPATGLYSQSYFLSQLAACSQLTTSGSKISSLLFIGIDKFSTIRHRYGINQAEQIVLDLAKFIQDNTNDDHKLAHYCDDSFTLLLDDTGIEKAKEFADSLREKIEQHIIDVESQSLQCTVSIGLVLLDSQLQAEPKQLIEYAFNTCESIRQQNDNTGTGNASAVYIPIKEKRTLGSASNDADLDAFLEEALEDGRFFLKFQPIVSLRGSSGEHYEVVTLTQDEDGEEQSTDELINSLNFTEANTRLDRWIILEATKQLASHIEDGTDTRLFINLTTNALKDDSLIPWLGVALKAGGIPASALTFQFTENDIIDYLKAAISFSETIHNLGCKLSIAEFGIIDDPIKNLKQVNANFTKMAEQYTDQLQSGGDSQALKTMIGSINENDAKAIICRVENAAALAQLWQLGVDYIQGEYLAGASTGMDYEFTDIA